MRATRDMTTGHVPRSVRTGVYLGVVAVAGALGAARLAETNVVAMLVPIAVTVLVACAAVLRRTEVPWAFPLAGVAAAVVGVPAILLPAMFSLGSRRRPRLAIGFTVLGVSAVAGFGTAQSRFVEIQGGTAFGSPVTAWVLDGVFVTVVPLLLGSWWGARRELEHGYRERAERAEAERSSRAREAVLVERARLAREAHDVLGHRLSLLSMQAGGLEVTAGAEADQVRRQAMLVRQTARLAIEDLREVIGALHEEDPPHGSIPHAEGPVGVDRLVGESRDAGASVALTVAPVCRTAWRTWPTATERAVVRIVQEGLTNAHRHAPGAPVDIELSGEPGQRVLVRVGNPVLAPTRAADAREDNVSIGGGRGIPGLRERARLAGGTVEAQNAGGRFVLVGALPWPAELGRES